MTEEITVQLRKLLSGKPNNLRSVQNIVWVIQLMRFRWAERMSVTRQTHTWLQSKNRNWKWEIKVKTKLKDVRLVW